MHLTLNLKFLALTDVNKCLNIHVKCQNFCIFSLCANNTLGLREDMISNKKVKHVLSDFITWTI